QLIFDLVKTWGEHRVIYGLEYQDRDFKNRQVRLSDDLNDDASNWVFSNIGALIPKANAKIYTAYAQDTFALGDSTQMRLGLRYDDYQYDAESDANYLDGTGTLGEISFDAISWTIGIEQALSEHLGLEAGVSTGFRAPTIEEMYSTNGSTDDWNTVANPDLESETSTNVDVALVGEYELGRFRLGVFYSQYDDFIDYETVEGININTGLPDPNGFNRPVNSGEVKMKGVELSASLDLSAVLGMEEGLRTTLMGAYTKGEHDNDDPVYSVQPPSATWMFNYDNPNGKWGLEFATIYTQGKSRDASYETNSSGQRVYPMFRSKTATVMDLRAYVDLMQDLRLIVGVYNLMDKNYYHWDSVRFIDQGDLRPGIGVENNGIRRYSETGRNFKVSLNYQF
ncbi:MAG: TonB-dependent receptor domain-containing protein, partial [Parahaliea sp.]